MSFHAPPDLASTPAPRPLPSSVRFGQVEVRPDERKLLVQGLPAAVGARAFDLLLTLIERRGRAVTKNELMEVVWPRVIVEENNLQVHISALRKLLGSDVIATIPGRGYRFTATLLGERSTAPRAMPDEEQVESAAARGHRPSGNLPERLPALYGREQDLRSLHALLDTQPLVTIVGAGGIGKTRLAQALAHELRGHYPHGVWMI